MAPWEKGHLRIAKGRKAREIYLGFDFNSIRVGGVTKIWQPSREGEISRRYGGLQKLREGKEGQTRELERLQEIGVKEHRVECTRVE